MTTFVLQLIGARCAKEHGPMYLATHHLYTEVIAGFLVFAVIDAAGIPTEQQLLIWCVLFGLIGGVCSLRFNPPTSLFGGLLQVFVNMALSGAVTPYLLTSMTSEPSIQKAFPMAVLIGIGADQTVSRLYPKVQAKAEAWIEYWVGSKIDQKTGDSK